MNLVDLVDLVAGEGVADDDDEEEGDAVQEPHVHHLDVGGDGERAGAVVEEGIQHEESGEAEGEAVL